MRDGFMEATAKVQILTAEVRTTLAGTARAASGSLEISLRASKTWPSLSEENTRIWTSAKVFPHSKVPRGNEREYFLVF